MSENIACNVLRASSTVLSSVQFQVDKLSPEESAYYQGSDPHFTYAGYTDVLPVTDPQLLRQNDLLVDTVVIDPKTTIARRYRVISDPEPFPDGHWELVLIRLVGKQA